MNSNFNELYSEIFEYQPFDEQEQNDKKLFLHVLENFDDALVRGNELVRFAASALVVDEDFNEVLLVKHLIYGGFIFPGGHADGESNLLSVAAREVMEETGIKVTPLLGGKPFGIEALPVVGHVKRGKYVPAHTHYDVIFLFKANSEDKRKIKSLPTENSEVKWLPIHKTLGEGMVEFVKPMFDKFIKKLTALKLIDDKK